MTVGDLKMNGEDLLLALLEVVVGLIFGIKGPGAVGFEREAWGYVLSSYE